MPAACAARRTPAIGGMAGNEAGASGEMLGIDQFPRGGTIIFADAAKTQKSRRCALAAAVKAAVPETGRRPLYRRRRPMEHANAPAPPEARRRRRFPVMRKVSLMEQAIAENVFRGKMERTRRVGGVCPATCGLIDTPATRTYLSLSPCARIPPLRSRP